MVSIFVIRVEILVPLQLKILAAVPVIFFLFFFWLRNAFAIANISLDSSPELLKEHFELDVHGNERHHDSDGVENDPWRDEA